MATIIKSDNVATNHLGSIIPNVLPANGLRGFFDFSNDDYRLDGANINLSSILNVSRSTTAIGIKRDGSEYVYAANTPRFHFVKSKNAYGLALGDQLKNHFLNSTAPVTQTISISEGNERKWFVYVQVKGTGSLTVSGAVSGIATEGNPLMLKVTQADISITATVSGTLTYAQVSKCTTPYGIDPSRPNTTGLVAQKTQEVTQIVRSLFDTLYGSGSNITVFYKMVRFDGGNLSLSPNGGAKNIMLFNAAVTSPGGGYVGLLEMETGSSAKLYFRKQKGGSILSTSPKIDVPVRDSNVVGFSLNRTSGKVLFNGMMTNLSDVNDVDPFMNLLPSLETPVNSEFISPNSILTKMVVYNRQLTNEEFHKVYDLLK